MKIHHPDTSPYENLASVGVAVGIPDVQQQSQHHIGLIYRTEPTQPVHFLHLAWHCLLRHESPPTHGFVWVESSLDPVNQTLLAAYCRLIVECHESGQIPYGIAYEGDYFDPATGAWLRGSVGEGLTCATFVMALYEALGLPLVAQETWPHRDSDVQWQETILKHLSRHASPEHIEMQRQKKGCIRFRPEEVGGATTSQHPPVVFDDAVVLGCELMDVLSVHLNLP